MPSVKQKIILEDILAHASLLNTQHDEWEEFQAPTDIVQVNAAECYIYTFVIVILVLALLSGQCKPLGYSCDLRYAERWFFCQQQWQAWTAGRRRCFNEGSPSTFISPSNTFVAI